jgi:hypothetical protein
MFFNCKSEVGMKGEIILTRSKTYIVPLLNDYIDINKGLLVNSYLYDINNPDINVDIIRGLFLMFKWSDNEVHRVYEERLLESSYTVLNYEVDMDYYMVYIKFPFEITNDVRYLLEGKYSKISDLAKQKILKYYNKNVNDKIYKILYKNPVLKKELENLLNITLDTDAELGSVFDLHSETFGKTVNSPMLNR